MKTILVTGGAGFIGSCFVRQCIAEQTVPRRQSRQADLRRQSRFAAAPSQTDPRLRVRPRRHRRPGGRRPRAGRASSRRRSSISRPSRTSIARSTVPAEFVRTNVQGTFQLLDAARRYLARLPAERRAAFRFLHVSTDEVYGSLGADGPVHRDEPLRSEFALFGVEGGGRSFRPGVFPHLRPAGAGDQLLEQLRPLPVSREADPADDPQRPGGQAAAGLRRRPERARLAVRRGPLPGAVAGAGRPAGPAKPTTSAATASRRTSTWCRRSAASVDELRPGLPHAPCSSLITFVKDRPGHDRRYAIDAGKIRRELGWQPRARFRRRACGGPSQWYLDNPQWVERVASGEYRRERLGLLREAASSRFGSDATSATARRNVAAQPSCSPDVST